MCEKIKDQDDSIKYEYIYIYIKGSTKDICQNMNENKKW